MNYTEHYNRLIDRARKRTTVGYTEKHHIVPKCMGGEDAITNLVRLYPEEHYVAHQLLVKMYPRNSGLIWAAVKMSSKSGQRNNKLYGWLRRQQSKIASQRVGEKNGSFGTKWIKNNITDESVKISNDTLIPEGWSLGRVVKKDKGNKCFVCGVKCGYNKYCNPHAQEMRQLACKSNAQDLKKV